MMMMILVDIWQQTRASIAEQTNYTLRRDKKVLQLHRLYHYINIGTSFHQLKYTTKHYFVNSMQTATELHQEEICNEAFKQMSNYQYFSFTLTQAVARSWVK